ncbi:DUF4304 domain-containing protein [Chryseolinea lacunae]|uniref:DUF4304 domain-containing protein n=1 Tax=Chryseolinea lacunae TaxID=2801331 RepID=A0ABS1KKN2_9BACT|nr:DUF4304 domain-containing protein [Chryseolinea lacunae]MBL0739910.1 DUF4304 domain-containing protein [Chryseolinea lacunae]
MDSYKLLLNTLAKMLKSRGFMRKGNKFYITKENNCAIIDFQKERGHEPGERTFTINIYIGSERVANFFGSSVKGTPGVELCHWDERVGYLLPQNKDVWWRISDYPDLTQLEKELEQVLVNYCIPEIDNNISDASLEKTWRARFSAGIMHFTEYKFFTALLKSYNRPDWLALATAFIESPLNKNAKRIALDHLEHLQESVEEGRN